MKVLVVGGFLGAGKTTLIRSLARHLHAAGERVAVVTNDQGHALVDTHLVRSELDDVAEIVGGCFCCLYDELEAALLIARGGGATVAIAEAVGSCTDLVATVLSPLAQRLPDLEVAPLAVAVDPWRVRQMETGGADELVAYLYRKQIEEADVVLLTRSDLEPPDVTGHLLGLAPNAALVRVSGRTGHGLEAWLSARPTRPAAPLTIDYGRYAEAEALLGWANATVHLESPTAFDPARVIESFLDALSDAPVAHVKVASSCPEGGSGSLVRQGAKPVLDTDSLAREAREASLLVNARVALPPDELEARLRMAMERSAAGATIRWDGFECFRPAPPTPRHRHVFRCGTGEDAACCSAFYDRADVRYLLGDSLHPGGVALTLRLADKLVLAPGGRVLDVACGRGTSLAAIAGVWQVDAVGLDVGLSSESVTRPRPATRIELRRGDAHAIPFEAGSFAAAICECALSTFADPERALSELRRVLRPGGRLALSDMVVEGALPAELEGWVNVGTCLAGARGFGGYADMLEEAGFRVIERWDASDGLYEMIRRVKKNLLGLALARATGTVSDDVQIDASAGRAMLERARETVDAGVLAYGAYVAERVG